MFTVHNCSAIALSRSSALNVRLRQFAALAVTNECERRRLAPGTRHVELTEAVAASVTAFLSIRRTRFPALAGDLADRFTADRLPGSTVRALRAAAVRILGAHLDPVLKPKTVRHPRVAQCDVFVSSVGSRRRTTKEANAAGFPSVSAWVEFSISAPPVPSEQPREHAVTAARELVGVGSHVVEPFREILVQRVNAHVDEVLCLIRAQGARTGYSARCARSHTALLEKWRAGQIAAFAP